jgi:hypothetical protein
MSKLLSLWIALLLSTVACTHTSFTNKTLRRRVQMGDYRGPGAVIQSISQSIDFTNAQVPKVDEVRTVNVGHDEADNIMTKRLDSATTVVYAPVVGIIFASIVAAIVVIVLIRWYFKYMFKCRSVNTQPSNATISTKE